MSRKERKNPRGARRPIAPPPEHPAAGRPAPDGSLLSAFKDWMRECARLMDIGKALAQQMDIQWALQKDEEDSQPPSDFRENLLCHRLKERLAPTPVTRSKSPVHAGWHVWRRAEAGGDFLDLLPMPDGRAWFLIGECSGWGATVAGDIAHIQIRVRGDCPWPIASGT